MKYKEYSLTGNCFVDFDTEIKFEIANARIDEAELIKLSIKRSMRDSENSRLTVCATKVLRSLKRAGWIQFFVMPEGFAENTTEAQFLLNKYYEFIGSADDGLINIFVKL